MEHNTQEEKHSAETKSDLERAGDVFEVNPCHRPRSRREFGRPKPTIEIIQPQGNPEDSGHDSVSRSGKDKSESGKEEKSGSKYEGKTNSRIEDRSKLRNKNGSGSETGNRYGHEDEDGSGKECKTIEDLSPVVTLEFKVKDRPCKAAREFEFGGPTAVRNTMIIMPLTVFLINWMCNKKNCSVAQFPGVPGLADLVDLRAWSLYLAWLAFQLALYNYLPGPIREGQPLADGTRLKYKLNGWSSFLVSLSLFGVALISGWSVSFIYKKMFALMTAAMVCSFLISAALYLKSFTVPTSHLNPAATTGYTLYDAYMGRELNPRLGDLDLKFFCELRPGLIGWVMLDLCFIAHAWQEGGHVPPSLLLISFLHFMYVADPLYFEDTVLTTLDLTTEGFGFMLVFGDLTFAPFLFSLNARFQLEHPQDWSTPALLTLLALNSVGYWIFRAANSEKDRFRNNPENPEFKGAFTIMTSSGRRLLASGWWGMCRHPNYLGDIIMALSWTLTAGFSHVLPWFYLLYLVGTLIHRSGRDHMRCAKKYRRDWQRYCAAVPYVILPGVY